MFRLLDSHGRFLEGFGGLSLARATNLQLCVSSQPVSLFICPSASALRPVSESYNLLQFVQLRRHSSRVKTLLCPGETRDHHPLAVHGSIFIGVDGRTLCHFSFAPALPLSALSPSLINSFGLSNCAVIVQQLDHSCVPERRGPTLWWCTVASLL